jgi:hypothetical protein
MEYIGDDVTEISVSVKRVLQTCCQQLRTHLQKRNALRDQKERTDVEIHPRCVTGIVRVVGGNAEIHQELEDPTISASASC